MTARVLIVGGYGVFGSRVAERLARATDIDVIIAGRNADAACASAETLARQSGRPVASAVVDATRPQPAQLAELSPAIIINASGPFQAQDLSLARAAIGAGAHYIDLADASEFVLALSTHAELDAQARERNLLLVTGASTVPAVTYAVVSHFAPRFASCEAVFAGISPGNSFDPGLATTRSILSSLGRPFAMRRNGEAVIAHGWQGLQRHYFPGIGGRWVSTCDVPDLTILPRLIPSLHTMEFRAGVELSLHHLGLSLLSWPARWGWLRYPERLAEPLLSLKRRFTWLGTDRGGMFVEIEGRGLTGERDRVAWHMIARSGHGPYIPASPAVIVAKKLARDRLPARGAMACVDLFTLPEFLAEVSDLDIKIQDSGPAQPA